MAGVLKPSPGALRIIDDLEGGLAIVVNGDTAPKNIAAGQYLFIKNHSTLATGGYHATAAISSGGTISSSNVAADADGIANSLKSNLLNVTQETLPYTNSDNKSVTFYFRVNTVVLSVIVSKGDHALKIPTSWTSIGTLPTIRPVSDRYIPVVVPGGNTVMVKITSSGGVQIQSTTSNEIWMQGSGTVIYK